MALSAAFIYLIDFIQDKAAGCFVKETRSCIDRQSKPVGHRAK